MNHKPLLAALFSALLVFSPLAVKADDVVNALPLDTETVSSTQTAVMLTPYSTSTELTASAVADPEPIPVSPAPSSTVVCLAIVEPNPLEGPEWIALYGLTPSTTDALIGWSLFDAQSSLLKFSTSTLLLWDEGTFSIRTELKSSRLNNGGDTVILKTPSGQDHDQLAYTETLKGERWLRGDCASPWRVSPERASAPTAPAVAAAPPIVTPPAPPAEPVEQPVVPTPLPDAEAPSSTTVTVPTEAVDPVITVTIAEIEEALPMTSAPVTATSGPATPSSSVVTVTQTQEPPLQTMLVIERPPAATVAVTAPARAPAPPAPPAPVAATTNTIKTRPPASNAPSVKPPVPKSSKEETKNLPIVEKKSSATGKKTPTPAKSAGKPTVAAKQPIAAKATRKKAAPKLVAARQEPIFTPLTMSALLTAPEPFQGVRVRIMGRVASQKGVIAANRYVLINADGRGLIVHATTKLPSPPQGTIIEVTGTITLNDEGLWLKQSTTDQWHAQTMTDEEKKAAIPTRNVNLVAPAQEDAWSNLTVEGKVTAVQKTSFDLDLDSGTIRVRVSSKLGYRTQRLQVGDTVSVQGLLDLRAEDPLIVPQTVDAIQILTRANLAGTTTGAGAKAPVSYPWLPVGAAASTLGLSEGFRRLRDRQKRRREEASFQALVQHHAQQERRELE